MNTVLERLLDYRNTVLWKGLKRKYNISLHESSSYQCNLYNRKYLRGKATIWYDIDNLKPEYFTHELLHLQIHKMGYNITRIIDEYLYDYSELITIWNRDVRNRIGNIIEHQKMLPIYIELGFRQEDFIGDYNIAKVSMSYFESDIFKECYSKEMVITAFTESYFQIKGCINPELNYSEVLNFIHSNNPILFDALEEFWLGWENINNENKLQDQPLLVKTLFSKLNELYLDQ